MIQFIKTSDNRIAVDVSPSFWQGIGGAKTVKSNGREWLARYYLQSNNELTEEEINSNTANGASKLYQEIRNMEVPRLTTKCSAKPMIGIKLLNRPSRIKG